LFLTKRTQQPVAPQLVDGSTLAQEEASLEQQEAALSARLLELSGREDQYRRAMEERRQALCLLARHLGEREPGAEAPFPSGRSGPTPERVKAVELRQAALAARKAALASEAQELTRREGEIQQAAELLRRWQLETERLRVLAEQRAEQERERVAREAEAAEAEKVRAAQAQAEAQRAASLPAPEPVAAPSSEPERRRAPRVALVTEVTLRSDSNFYTGFSCDLSDGGIFVATCDVRPPGTEVDLSFTLPGHRSPIQAAGVVRWIREYNDRTPEVSPGMGIQLTSMASEDHAAVAKFIREREPLFF